MHQVSSAGESEKSLQRPVLMNSSAIKIPTLFKTHVQLAKAETVLTCHQQFHQKPLTPFSLLCIK